MRREASPSSGLPEGIGPEGLRIALLVARFNDDITGALLTGARAALKDHGIAEDAIDVIRVPGAWELPQAAARVVDARGHDAVVALGCVIRGETPHFDFISEEATRGLGAVARSASIPVTFGVLTTEDLEQARERADPERLDKGGEAAAAALEMMGVFRRIQASRGDSKTHPGNES